MLHWEVVHWEVVHWEVVHWEGRAEVLQGLALALAPLTHILNTFTGSERYITCYYCSCCTTHCSLLLAFVSLNWHPAHLHLPSDFQHISCNCAICTFHCSQCTCICTCICEAHSTFALGLSTLSLKENIAHLQCSAVQYTAQTTHLKGLHAFV